MRKSYICRTPEYHEKHRVRILEINAAKGHPVEVFNTTTMGP